jgi:hypothetical protein
LASIDPDFHGAESARGTEPAGVEPRRRGCLFYGVVTAAVLAVLLMVGLALAAWVSYRTIVRYRDMYTSTAPVALPKLETSERERQRAVARIKAFYDAVEAGKAVKPLILSGDDLNALIQESPRLKDRVYTSIDDDRIKAKVSFPLSELKDISLTRGRYLNGEAEVKLKLDDGKLKVEIVSMRAEGKDLPPMVRDFLTNADLVLSDDDEDEDDTDDERRLKRFLGRLDSLEVDDGVIVVKPREPDG